MRAQWVLFQYICQVRDSKDMLPIGLLLIHLNLSLIRGLVIFDLGVNFFICFTIIISVFILRVM